ncbi:MAG: hypothetical protein WBD55_03960, partial [Dehalococcoidia bacterium]
DLHGFNWPEACPDAYWIPDQFFIAWLNNTWFGQARSSVQFSSFSGYYQYFRHGIMFASTFGGTPYQITSQPITSCSP